MSLQRSTVIRGAATKRFLQATLQRLPKKPLRSLYDRIPASIVEVGGDLQLPAREPPHFG